MLHIYHGDGKGKTTAAFDFSDFLTGAAAQYACILLDEALDALQLGILQEIEMLAFLNANKAREIILTGRNPSKNILACGDYITQMKMEKHPYQKQQAPRKGVEY